MALFQLVVVAICAWLHCEQTDLIAFLREENRVLKSRLNGRRLRFDDGEWRRLGELGHHTAFLIELSRRVQVLGSTPYPDEAFVNQCLRSVSSESDVLLQRGRILVCDRDPKWSPRSMVGQNGYHLSRGGNVRATDK